MKISQYRSLRGGGIVCSHHQIPKKVQSDCGIDDDLIQHLIHDIECKCHGILDASKRIGLNESKENIMMNIGWFHKSSQFIHQIRQNKKMVQENIKIVLTNLEVLLEAIINIIQSQRFYTWLILKICNAFSLLIFIYYINNPNPPMKLQDQEKLLQYLAEIQQYLKEPGQSNSYENSIQYEFELLQMCIETCPTNSKEGQEIIINTFSGIISSIMQLSPSSDLISALGQGALYLYKENSKRKQKEIFQIIFYIEELKWQIIEQIQNGKGLHNILMILGDNYKKLVEKSHSWIIRCSWIKMISELISHKPLITYGRFHQLMHQFQLDKTWDQVIQQKVVKPIDENKLIGVIQKVDSNEQAVRILQQQYTIFEQLQNVCLNGNQDIPQFENLIQFNEKEKTQEKKTLEEIDKIVKLQQYIENIKINELQEASNQLLTKYQDYIDGFINLKDYINSNHKQFLQQIDYLQMQSSNINSQLYDYYLQCNIVDQQLITILQLSDEVINKNDEILVDKLILVILIKSYFNIIMELKYNLGSFKEEFEQFSMYFPDNNLKITLTSQEFKLFIQDIFDQIKDNDFNKLIIKLELTLKYQRSKIKMNPTLLVRKYSEVLNQLILIIFYNLRQDFNIEQQYLLYFEQL